MCEDSSSWRLVPFKRNFALCNDVTGKVSLIYNDNSDNNKQPLPIEDYCEKCKFNRRESELRMRKKFPDQNQENSCLRLNCGRRGPGYT